MASVFSILATIVFVTANSANASLTKYNLTHAKGDVSTYFTQQPSLQYESPIVKTCQEGLWVRYSGENYNENETGPSWAIVSHLLVRCDETINQYRSLRTGGVLEDYNVPSATVYSKTVMGGVSLVITDSVAKLEFPIQSVLTGYTNLEVFTEEDFQGDSYCANLILHLDVGVAFTPSNIGDAPWDISLAKSARIGCTLESSAVKREIPANYEVSSLDI